MSDFDGVWTDPTEEYRAVRESVIRELAVCLQGDEDLARESIERIATHILETPGVYGWQADPKDERLSSFVDEDFFCLPAAIGHYLAGPNLEAPLVLIREAICRHWPNLPKFMDHCFHSTCDAFRKEVDHDLAPGAEGVLAALLDAGVRVTFVSNAPATKIQDWFGHHGFQVEDAREEQANSLLRVYGRAGKQWLGPSNQALKMGGRLLFTDRPQYREILIREDPDMVLGDVLSLDLALPLAMRQEEHPAAPSSVTLLTRLGPPDWVRDSIGQGGPDHLLQNVRQLPDLIRSLASTPRMAPPSQI